MNRQASSKPVDRFRQRDDGARRPWLGVGLLLASAVATLAILVYFGAWAASDRVTAREQDPVPAGTDVAAWEEGLLYVCPFH